MNDSKRTNLISLWRYAISFLVGVIIASFTVGSARQKVKDLVAWKEVISPKIERMDSIGSLSFDHFHKQYEKDQQRIDSHLQTLDKDVKELQRKHDP